MADVYTDIDNTLDVEVNFDNAPQDINAEEQATDGIQVGAQPEQLLSLIGANERLAATNARLADEILPTLRGGLQTKEVSPADIEQVITPDDGYLGLQRVKVAPYEREVQMVNKGKFAIPSDYEDDAEVIAKENYRSDYACVVACVEYKSDVATLQLIGADAYLTSDGDFYDSGATHTWHDNRELKITRWVCFYFKNADCEFNVGTSMITAIALGVQGNLMTLSSAVATLLTKILVNNGSSIGNIAFTAIQPLKTDYVIRGVKEIKSGLLYGSSEYRGVLYIDIQKITGGNLVQNYSLADTLICTVKEITSGAICYCYNVRPGFPNLKKIILPNVEIINSNPFYGVNYGFDSLTEVEFPKLRELRAQLFYLANIAAKNTIKQIRFPSLSYISSSISNVDMHFEEIHYDTLRVANANLQCFSATIYAPALEEIHGTGSNPTANLIAPKLRIVSLENLYQYFYVFSNITADTFEVQKSIEVIGIAQYDSCVFYNMKCNIITLPNVRYFTAKAGRNSIIGGGSGNVIKKLVFTSIERFDISVFQNAPVSKIEYMFFGCKGEREYVINIVAYATNGIPDFTTDIEIGDGALQNITIKGFNALTRENIVNHILVKLGDNTGQSALTLTLGATNLAKLTDEDKAIATAKNWTLA